MLRSFLIGFACLSTTLVVAQEPSAPYAVTVTATVVSHAAHARASRDLANVVLWLTPIDAPLPPSPHAVARLVQKNKEFQPHLLVIPAGSSVEFPNLDPFFHNVFSLFDGKRFDLGLYEAGASRTVRFEREGVSYIFCNIHPEMGAVIVALTSPYYGISKRNGSIELPNVPPGRYALHVWSEAFRLATPSDSTRIVTVSPGQTQLGEVVLSPIPDSLAHHKNKFGEDYPPQQKMRY